MMALATGVLVDILPVSGFAVIALDALLILASLLVIVFLTVTGYLHYVHWKYSHLPQPKRPSFYLGHLLDLIHVQKETGNDEVSIVDLIQRWSEQVGTTTFVVFFLHSESVIITDAESVKTIIMHPEHSKDPIFIKKFVYLMGERFMGRGLFTILDYDTWKPRRQIYDPAFKKSYLKTLLEPFNEIANKFIASLLPLADGKTEVPMKTKLGEFTLEIISKVAFGFDFTQQLTEQDKCLKSGRIGKRSLTYFVDTAFKGVDMSLRVPGYQYIHPFKAAEYREVSRAVRAIGRDCIKSRIHMVESGEEVPNDILTHILQGASTRKEVDIEDLVDDFVTFYIAGQETTSNLLTFALVLTLLHPNVLERVQVEVDDILSKKDYVSFEDLEKLEYTEQVLKETLRLYGPVPGISKKISPDGVTLNGFNIPPGTRVTLATANMCRMPVYFDDPDTFNPNRFDPENKKPNSFVYFPFGLGHRACIGKHFAMMEAKIVFARLFQTYKITLPESYELVSVLRGTIQTKDNVHCYLQRRQA